MRGSRREDLDVARLGEIGKRADEIPTESRSVRLAQPTVRAHIELRELGAALIRSVGEAAHVGLGPRDLIVDVLDRANVDVAIGELLDQDRRKPYDDAIRNARIPEVVQEDEQREICPKYGLMYPFLTVRPSARPAGIRKVRMQREDERTHTRILWQGRRGGSGPPRASCQRIVA